MQSTKSEGVVKRPFGELPKAFNDMRNGRTEVGKVLHASKGYRQKEGQGEGRAIEMTQ